MKMKNFLSIAALFLLAMVAFSFTKNAPQVVSDYLLEIDGIKGESRIQRGALDVRTFQLDSFSRSMTFGKIVDRTASPSLSKFSKNKNQVKTAVFKTKAKGKNDYYKVVLEDVLISGYQTSGKTSSESFALNYAKIKFFQAQNGHEMPLSTERGFEIFRRMQE